MSKLNIIDLEGAQEKDSDTLSSIVGGHGVHVRYRHPHGFRHIHIKKETHFFGLIKHKHKIVHKHTFWNTHTAHLFV